MNLTRREFFVLSTVFMNKFPSQDIIEVNLPEYMLRLKTPIKTYKFPVAIGRGTHGHKETPIGAGNVYEKRKKVFFRYGHSYPNLNINKGDIIKWTNTFDSNGKPIGYRMPYKIMRGLGMKIYTGGYTLLNFVIHSTTDEFTIGTPASSGCLRVGLDDMLRLYSLTEPKTKTGKLKNPIPLILKYEIINIKKEIVKLHADVYNKINYYTEFLEQLKKKGYRPNKKAYKIISEHEKEFKKTHVEISHRLSSNFPKNYISPELKSRLHAKIDLYELITGT